MPINLICSCDHCGFPSGSSPSHRPVLQEPLSVLPLLPQQEPKQQRLRLQQREGDGHQVTAVTFVTIGTAALHNSGVTYHFLPEILNS